jgi:hypothetical protein
LRRSAAFAFCDVFRELPGEAALALVMECQVVDALADMLECDSEAIASKVWGTLRRIEEMAVAADVQFVAEAVRQKAESERVITSLSQVESFL